MKTRMLVTILVFVLTVMVISVSCVSSMSMVDRTPEKFEIHYKWAMFDDWFNDQMQILEWAADETLARGFDYFYLWNLGCEGCEKTATDNNGTLVSNGDPVKAIERSYGECPQGSTCIFLVEPVHEAKYGARPHNAQYVKEAVREKRLLRGWLSGQ